LYFRERCSSSFDESCLAIRDFYTKGEDSHGLSKYWAHVDGIPLINTCPICTNIGFQALITALPVGKFKYAPKCFLAGTDVLMADGDTKDIEDIEVGDMVMATDPETGKQGPRRVTRLIRSEGEKQLNTLTILTPDGPENLTATREHPFWSPSERAWVEAGDLAPGMTLRTDTGEAVEIAGNKSFTKRTRTYNFTVDELHTYYVLAGATPVLVHNSCGVFSNSMPGTLGRELALAERLGVKPSGAGSAGFDSAVASGTVKWAVREDGSLVVIPKFVNGQEISHSVLTRGAPVRAAGEADIAGSSGDGYFGLEINNHSGHFLPSTESLQVGRDAFGAAGVHF
ncbi:polymorphic toxin-type HINT domain-containing protein, partial [Streptomyces sp. NPDC018352]|uniref:polymorphic toxin-type HINT domain-containing protein n=1 Tax=Streptomyces sp. NPDC018352 TaxID=3157194 RepID=UPI00340A6685